MAFHRMPISDEQYIAEARRSWAYEGEIEIDDDAEVSVSETRARSSTTQADLPSGGRPSCSARQTRPGSSWSSVAKA
jgi:hypothetical protein